MMPISAARVNEPDLSTVRLERRRVAAQAKEPTVFADIYQEQVHIAIWKRELSRELNDAVSAVLSSSNGLQLSMTVSPQSAQRSMEETLSANSAKALCDDISELVTMFCCLFEIDRVGLRLTALDKAMCPRFHVDHVPCRFVTTYQGPATEWLPHHAVDRARLGRGNNGLADCDSGLYRRASDIRQLDCGDVALLKGELWEGNENAGLVHRSPAVPDEQRRLILTLDMMSH